MSDPRRRRAQQLREKSVELLHDTTVEGMSAYVIWWKLREAFPGSLLTHGQLRHALATLRDMGRVQYYRSLWRLMASK